MDEQREQSRDERPEATGELADEELEQVSGGFWAMLSGWRWRPLTVVSGHAEEHTNEMGD